jgi:serine/threonine protein kinase
VQGIGEVSAGHTLGRYELLMPIASGGMAMVWAARLRGTRGFQKIVAIKTMLPKLSEDEQFEQMFLDEASLASQIRHPHVVEILDLGEENGILYLVMEMVDGIPLNQLMKASKKRGGIPLPIGVRIVMQACAGLHAAHELRDGDGQLVGLVHRDVSPQNILITYEGVTKVVDFGIAKATAVGGGGATVAGQIKGKVAYMAPEQVKGNAIDRRVDLFAMGIVLYALTTGKHPLRRESEAATMYNIAAPDPVMPPSRVVAGYPPALERVVMQALAKDPAKRYPTANDLLRALDQALPASMRASTDDDVGAFVKGIFAERREDRQQALKRALEMADRQVEGRAALLAGGQMAGTLSPMSAGSLVSGVTSNLLATPVDTGFRTGSLPGTPAWLMGIQSRQRRLVLAAAGLVLLAGAGILAWASQSGPSELRTPESPQPSALSAANRHAEKPLASQKTPEKTAADGTPSVALSSLPPPNRIAQSISRGEAQETRPTESAPRMVPYRPIEIPRPKPANTSWKQDPGF